MYVPLIGAINVCSPFIDSKDKSTFPITFIFFVIVFTLPEFEVATQIILYSPISKFFVVVISFSPLLQDTFPPLDPNLTDVGISYSFASIIFSGISNSIVGSTLSTFVIIKLFVDIIFPSFILLAKIVVSLSIVNSFVYLFHVVPKSKLYSFLYPSGYVISIVLLLVQFTSFIDIDGIVSFFSNSFLIFISFIVNSLLPTFIINL